MVSGVKISMESLFREEDRERRIDPQQMLQRHGEDGDNRCNHVKENGEREIFVLFILDGRGRQRNIQHVRLAERERRRWSTNRGRRHNYCCFIQEVRGLL